MKTLLVTDPELTMITDALKAQALRCATVALAEAGDTETCVALRRATYAEGKAHRALAERLARGEPPREGTPLDAVIVNLTPAEIADVSAADDGAEIAAVCPRVRR